MGHFSVHLRDFNRVYFGIIAHRYEFQNDVALRVRFDIIKCFDSCAIRTTRILGDVEIPEERLPVREDVKEAGADGVSGKRQIASKIGFGEIELDPISAGRHWNVIGKIAIMLTRKEHFEAGVLNAVAPLD